MALLTQNVEWLCFVCNPFEMREDLSRSCDVFSSRCILFLFRHNTCQRCEENAHNNPEKTEMLLASWQKRPWLQGWNIFIKPLREPFLWWMIWDNFKYLWTIFNFFFFYQSMELIGGNEIQLPSLKRENISYVFPNKVSSSLMNVYLFTCFFLFTQKDQKSILQII